jgi:ubiquinone/menaquinone biosynthesis C-methylase UbiE
MSNETLAEKIQTDFDLLASLERPADWNHNRHYHKFLLAQLSLPIGNALEIGCGSGEFCRLLANRSERVLGLDFSAGMLDLAWARSAEYPNIEYMNADILTHDFGDEKFDCITSIATLHHMPLRQILPKLRDILKPGGTLLVLDLYQPQSASELAYAGLALVPNVIMSRLKNKQPASPEARAAWEEHGKTDVYLPMRQIRRICADVLPGASVRRHFFWRYSIVFSRQ